MKKNKKKKNVLFINFFFSIYTFFIFYLSLPLFFVFLIRQYKMQTSNQSLNIFEKKKRRNVGSKNFFNLKCIYMYILYILKV